MPEVGIGFFPDIGATWFLPRLPGRLGTYCALTGERLDAANATAAGVATHRVASIRFPELVEALCADVAVDAVLGAFAEPASKATTAAQGAIEGAIEGAIDRLFNHARMEDVWAALDAEAAGAGKDAAFASKTAVLMRAKSPTSLKIALAQMRRGPALDFNACMRTEFRIVSRVMRGQDFYEGVRAVIIDKDQAPRWHPATLEAVSEGEVERYFAPLASELDLQ
jgi:enoyl-CoA hydratase